MPLQVGPTPFFEQMVSGFASNGLASTGTRTVIIAPFRGRLMEAGFQPIGASVTSAMTMAVSIGNNDSAAISNFAQVITSTLGTFASTVLPEGGVASVVPPTTVFVNRGDAIQFTLSGGQAATIAATVYAIVRRA